MTTIVEATRTIETQEPFLGGTIVCTHISQLLFTADRVYKRKRPVHFGFVDFSTRAAREAACRREVELNRRLAPDVYLGVVDIEGPDGDVFDHAVAMRRMPDDRRLSSLIAAGTDVRDELRTLAKVIAAFHERSERSPEIDEAAERDSIARRWRANIDELRPYTKSLIAGDDLKRIERLAFRFLFGRKPLFDARIAQGRIRDGHGDLQADDIFLLEDGPRVLDCLEFNDELRYGDVLGDVAFLAMDLERIGAPDLAQQFVAWWAEFSGDSVPQSLLHHYVAYFALVRAKVACLRAQQGPDEEAAIADARQLLALCREHLERARVQMVLVGGLPGTGKSTVADAVAAARQWVLLRSDVVRKSRVTNAPDRGQGFAVGVYSPEQVAATYGTLLARAARCLAMGESVVLDATWRDPCLRAAAADVATHVAADVVALRCDAPRRLAEARLRKRLNSFESEATPEVALRMRQHEKAWPGAGYIDTRRSPQMAVRAALAAIDRNPWEGQ